MMVLVETALLWPYCWSLSKGIVLADLIFTLGGGCRNTGGAEKTDTDAMKEESIRTQSFHLVFIAK